MRIRVREGGWWFIYEMGARKIELKITKLQATVQQTFPIENRPTSLAKKRKVLKGTKLGTSHFLAGLAFHSNQQTLKLLQLQAAEINKSVTAHALSQTKKKKKSKQ